MTVTGTPVLLKVDGQGVIELLQEAGAKLDNADGEVVLDFSLVRRIDPNTLRAMEGFAARADEKAVKVVLRGVNVNVYKVLKLARLSPRFSFVA